MLAERVTIIIHAAASVRLNESLTNSIFINLRSIRDTCILAQRMKNLIALVYVSTAFAHVENAVIEEKIYPPVTDWRKMIKVAEHLDEYTLNILTAKYINDCPNAYIFTKKLAENIIEEYSSSLPCAIVRPSMILPSLSDPFPGWVDNMYGPIGIWIGSGKGVLRVIYHSKHIILDTVPIDFVNKTVVAVPWKLGLTNSFTPSSPTFVVNCTSQRNTTMYVSGKMGFLITREVPVENIVWTLNTIFTDNYILFYTLTILCHVLPAMLIDSILKFSGSKPMLMKLVKKLYVANYALKHFMINQWKFNNANNLALMSSIPFDDQNVFSFEWSNVNATEYIKNCIIGGKKFLLYEDMNRLDAAKTHYKRVRLGVMILKTIVTIGMLWITYKYIFTYTF